MINISNEHLDVTINPMGAELQSCFNKTESVELIWQAHPKHWGKHAPVLFPAVGKLWNNKLKIKGTEYTMQKHGFAREMQFEVRNITSNYAQLYLKSNKETKLKFPFDFEFNITFHVLGKELKITYSIKNLSKTTMPFCIGAHPAFNVPAFGNDAFNTHYIKFTHQEKARRILLTEEGFLTGKTQPNWLDGDRIELNDELFKNDAIILDQLKSNELALLNSNGKGIGFKSHNFSSLAFWKPLGAPFLCLEPWNGMADIEGFDDEYRKKSGSIKVKSFDEFSCTHSMFLV